ncbi:aspartate-alanine antiporter [Paracoccus aestuariivivens]|uniref:Aspartate-alanine antiporter n=1 Tax=Paracoccus aestuariivivens TaxID=1820333 RepID=A0A6L6JA70_9RHOB|nr:aspartate-alanine antiporter [Paracoccus aestuariivivens]MTH77014.1 aspartate-alanine antiporter [Paracoccus aestuariivivens]
MEAIRSYFDASPIAVLFVCVAIGFALGRIKIAGIPLGGIPGTLFAAIVVGQIGVEVDNNIKTMAFALFIYSLGYVSGPSFFQSLGRSTLNLVNLSLVSSALIYATIWGLARVFSLDKGTAAGLLAGGITESAAVGTASEALGSMTLPPEQISAMQANIGVAYAITYLFGFTLVVFFVSLIAPKLMGIDLKAEAAKYTAELGIGGDDDLDPGQESALRGIVARAYQVTRPEAEIDVASFEKKFNGFVTVQRIIRRGRAVEPAKDRKLALGDRVALLGRLDELLEAETFLGLETTDTRGLDLIGETRTVVLTNKDFIGETIMAVRAKIDPQQRRGTHVVKITRAGQNLIPRPKMRLQAGDVVSLYGMPEALDNAVPSIGYAIDQGIAVDYVYLGLGIIVGILIGMITVPIAGSPVALHTGGGCLLSGLLFGWLRSRHPKFGGLPPATALHLRDFGLAIFIACVGLGTGPQAVTLLKQQGILLPVLAIIAVTVPIVLSLLYARYVLRMNPAVICGALAGCFTCTAGLNAAVQAAENETPVLGYTVPYAISNVTLTLMGPILVLTV